MSYLRVLALCLLASVAAAQTGESVQVTVRVTSLGGGGTVVIDRGSGSQLEVDDVVFLQPRIGVPVEGVITDLEDRSAVVRLYDTSLGVSVGTRGYVEVPRDRFGQEGADPVVTDPSRYSDDAWQEGMPLLAGIEAVDPAARTPLFRGRQYFIVDQTWTTEKGRKDSFYRAGSDLTYENPFGHGGRLQLDTEFNYRSTHAFGLDGEDSTKLRFDRASYLWGGTRFEEERREVGRFLLNGMPEFGVIDGFEYGRRRDNGDRYGYSFGFMPLPDQSFESGHDAQVSAFYEWHPSETDSWVLTGGYQRTFHGSRTDRDLIIAKVRYEPTHGWDFYGTTWIDLYSDSDDTKPLIELTHLLAVANKRFGKEGGMTLRFRHWTFPELDRYEFLPVLDQQLGKDHSERASFSGWKRVGDDKRLHGEVGLWIDEDEAGGDLEVGLEKRGVYIESSRADLTGFVTAGEFSRVVGLRGQYDWRASNGRWSLFYSIENQEQLGFNVLDQLIQHWFRVSRDFQTESGWNLNLRGETLLFGDETSWSVGVYVQKSF